MRNIILLLCASAAVAGGCSSLNMTGATSAGIKAVQALTLSDSQIEQYVGQYIHQLDAQSSIAPANNPYSVRLNRIAGTINNRNGINIKVYLTPDVNAFAVADGSVRVYSGLMDIMSDEEVLGVIGHEIGHVKLKHTKEAFKNALLTSALREGIASTGGIVGQLSASEFGALAESLSQSQYSQKQEYEADDYGYEFLKSNGLNPWAMALSFEKLKDMEQKMGSQSSDGLMQLFSTHPELDARIDRMEKRAAREGYSRPSNGNTINLPAKQQSTQTGRWSY